ncbi:Carbohydrate-selective porin [Hyphomicrobium sulfonivorans]|uniref:Carbohydrate-selective porin n=1 Tax=Hyphomicrobium sulfonivorans TaxID=121290 RepID=A0A109BDK8_HYPSL|nr:carbohydrate porin [Hyphomicrobium sulfonivorans]KWT66791.1 Carbohydrate-selective porin [Hyphomicrobium sulfonivorans]
MTVGETLACIERAGALCVRASAGFVVAQILIILIVCVAPRDAYAQTAEQEADRIPGLPEPSIAMNFPREFGDPAGLRSALAGRGVTFAVNYIGEVMGNPTGGFSHTPRYMGRLDLQLAVDLEKAAGWKGLSFFANGYQIHGQSISALNLGALMPASFIESLPTTRLFEIYLEQKLLDDRMSLRVGQLSADSEFIVSESGSAFLNASFGWPSIAGINLPDGGPTYPMAAPGARLAFAPNDTLDFRFGIFSGDPAGGCPDDEGPLDCNPYGVLFPFTAPLFIGEATIKYNQNPGELAGKLKFGAYRYFGSYVPTAIGNNGLPIGLFGPTGTQDQKDYAFYAILDQMVYRVPGTEEQRGVTLFGSYIAAPPDGNLIQRYFEAGVTLRGLLDERPRDTFGIGFIYTGVSSQVVDFYRTIGDPVVPNFEAVLEISYTAEIMRGLYVQPDFQYFWNPGGHSNDPVDPTRAIPSAAVFGIRTTINY